MDNEYGHELAANRPAWATWLIAALVALPSSVVFALLGAPVGAWILLAGFFFCLIAAGVAALLRVRR